MADRVRRLRRTRAAACCGGWCLTSGQPMIQPTTPQASTWQGSEAPRAQEVKLVSVDDNRALVCRFYEEVWNRGNVGVAQEIFAEDYVRHDLRPTRAEAGGAGQAKIAEDFRRAFPDPSFDVDLVVAEGDLVAARWTAEGTHSGPWVERSQPGRTPDSRESTSSVSAVARL
jgi:predicted ester cyclase